MDVQPKSKEFNRFLAGTLLVLGSLSLAGCDMNINGTCPEDGGTVMSADNCPNN